MYRFKSVWQALFGDLDQISSEKYFVTLTSFAAAVFLLILCLVHIFMGLKMAPVILAGSSSLVMLGLYYFLRFRNCLYIPKVILTVLGLFMLDLTWYSKYLSNGPVLFFIFIFAALVIWVWDGKWLAILLLFYFLNLAVLGFIDANAPASLFQYPDADKRSLDIYLSHFLYSSLLIILLYVVKKEFVRQKEKAMKSDKLKSAFLANMSHEIRTPMNAIVGFSQLLSNGTSNENRQKYIDIIQTSGDNLLRLINDIIDLSKIEAEDLKIKNSEFSVRELFVELQEIYSIELDKREKRDIQFNFNLPDDDVIINSDPLRLKQVLSNLLNNAMKFTSQGKIILSCEKKGKDFVFSVSDTGTGIPKEDQDKIFDRFTRFNYLGMNTEGSGIGLSIAEKLVYLLKGKIWFKSVYGKGSDFYFSIPSTGKGEKSASGRKSDKMILSQKTKIMRPILVVEDDKTSYILIQEFLKPLDLVLHHVTDGEKAIDYIKLNPEIRLILMDLKLPSVDGYEATKIIKQINPEIHIIAQTAYAMLGDREKAINAGCDDYLTKPIDLKKLQAAVNKYL